ncbi:MAG: helix-turn-helix transcriptional regulator [Candidatus Giovannonibacteria bacterium]|nr:MAG: helix-turn-helix transcriptional regulator [Candidatus Giovannonibacteria bacterium]
MEKNNELGQILKAYREKAFPDQGLRRVAAKIGIDYAHLFRIELGQYTPADETLLKILDTYGIKDLDERLKVFNLARLSPSHQEAIEKVAKQYEGKPQEFVEVFYRKSRKNKSK